MCEPERKRILIVDDERSLADTMAAIMEATGRPSRIAYSADEALEILRTEATPALMICDVLMPGMNGVELAVQVRRQWPEVRILLISGNTATEDILRTACAHGYAFEILAKPVPPRQLLLKVGALLNSANSKTEHS